MFVGSGAFPLDVALETFPAGVSLVEVGKQILYEAMIWNQVGGIEVEIEGVVKQGLLDVGAPLLRQLRGEHLDYWWHI